MLSYLFYSYLMLCTGFSLEIFHTFSNTAAWINRFTTKITTI